MTPVIKHLSVILVILILFTQWGCTDRRTPVEPVVVEIQRNAPPESLVAVSDIRFNGQDINPWTMVVRHNRLYTTGTPYGFLSMSIENPASPQLVFTVSEQIDRLFPRWVAPWYASGALAIRGQGAFMSGTVGISVISMAETSRPQEVRRDPPYDENSEDIVADDAKIWSTAVFHPNQPYLYAFRQQDHVLTYRVSGAELKLVSKDSYGERGTTVCCANASTIFGNTLYVAFRNRLLFFSLGSNGALNNPREFVGLQAGYVASSANYLYVFHEASFDTGSGTDYPTGIYVFNKEGKNVAYLAANPSMFQVTANDSHLFVVGPEYENGAAIRVFRIMWVKR